MGNVAQEKTTVKVFVPYIRYISPSKVLIGKSWHSAVLCQKNKLPSPPPYGITCGTVELPTYVAREI